MAIPTTRPCPQSLFTGNEMAAARRGIPKTPPTDATPPVMAGVPRGAILTLQAVAIVVGVWAGWRIFDWGNG